MKTISGLTKTKALEQKVLAFIRSAHIADEGSKLVVAVSGGPDSVCLLRVLICLREELGLTLHIAHLNHGLRGADSDADAAFVSEMAYQSGIPATIETRDVRAFQAEHRLSLEEAAREVRYDFLAGVAAATGSRAVAAGHTLDDNGETILMHLVRGSGVAGLRGLMPSIELNIGGRRLRLVRPLLQVTREETSGYCRGLCLAPRTDLTNFSPEPLRNRIRHELVPLLEKYNPRIREALLRTAAIAGEEIDFIASEAERCWRDMARMEPGGIILERQRMNNLPVALQREVIRRALQSVAGTLKDFESVHIDDMVALLSKPVGKQVKLQGGLVFSVEYDCYRLSYDPAICPFSKLDGEFPLKVPGETGIPGWSIHASVAPCRPDPEGEDCWSAYLDHDSVGERITVRVRRPGDVFQPLGMSEAVKLKDFMINSKMPQAWRQRVPLFIARQGIVWVGGWRIAEPAKITPETKTVLHIRMERR